MLRSIISLALVGATVAAQAQVPQGGQPIGWGAPADHFTIPPSTTLPTLDRRAADGTDQLAEGGFRYGEQRFLDVDVLGEGQWTPIAGGGRVCRYLLTSPGALMISMQFGRFHPAPGAAVFLYDRARTAFIGGFTEANELSDGGLATAVVPGDAVVIEYQEPAGAPSGLLHVASLTHAYRDVLHLAQADALRDIDPGYQSAPCHNNVICPIAADWQDQKRSVALFMRPDGGGCTGTLLNNTLQNGTPYFLIANHCYQPNEGQWVFYFNYDSPGCVGSVGPTTQTVSGSSRKAILYHGDYCLMQMASTPPSNFNVYYAGWDRSGAAPQSGACVLHPLSDVKKISFYNTTATSVTTAGEGTPCWQVRWNSGIMEAGGSGAPLFDQNKRVVGHLIDGAQTCATATTDPSRFSKFSANWDGASSGARLRDWLDPANTTTALNGFDPNGSGSTGSVKLKLRAMLEGPYVQSGGLMNATLRGNGLVPLTEPYTALGYTHVGGGGGETTTAAVLAVSTTVAVVDWIVIELRNKSNSAQVLATRAALIRRDGTIVDVDGTSDVTFANRASDQYFIAVRHRNHLGIMTAAARSLSGTATLINLINGSVALYGTSPTKSIGGIACMWAGDVRGDGTIRYTGMANDRDPVLVRIGGTVPTAIWTGYGREDVNLDGVVKYTGSGNDRDPILSNVGSLPTSVRTAAMP